MCWHKRSSVTPSLSSLRPSQCGSIADTEDFYCDDELHPSLENDPNMRLQQCGTDLMPGIEFGKQLFQSGDDESILSMELCSGPPSLSLPPPTDEASLANAGLEGRLTLAWGVEQGTDLSSDEDTNTA